MGRYYKTSTPQNLDFMYQLPQEVMMRATQQASEDISQNQAAMLSLYDKLPIAAIDKDKGRAKEIIGEYEGKLGELTKTLQDNPLEFRRKSGDIIGLSRDIQKNFTQGEAAAIQSRYSQRAVWIKQQDDLVKAGRIKDPQAIMLMLAENDRNTKDLGYNSTTGSANDWHGEQLIPDMDIEKKYMDFAKEIRSHITAGANSYTDGKFIHNSSIKRDVLTKEEIDNIIWQKFQADEDTQAYLRQRSRIGQIEGFYDQKGGLVNPFAVTGEQTDPKTGKKSNIYGWNTNTKLGSMFNSISDVYDKNDILAMDKSMTTDGYGVAKYADGLKTAASATPDSFNTAVSQRGTLASLEDYKAKVAIPSETIQMANGFIQAGYYKTLQSSGKNTAQVNADMMSFNVQLKTAQEEANNGNPAKLTALYAQYAPASGVPAPNIKIGISKLSTLAEDKTNAEIYGKQLETMKNIVVRANPIQAGEKLEDYDKRVQTEVESIITDPAYNTNTTDLFATSGNNNNFWADPTLKAMAIKEIKGVSKTLADPEMWGAGENKTFFVSLPDGNTGKMKTVEMNLQQAREKFLNFSSANKKIFAPVEGKTDEEIAMMSEAVTESVETGKITNKVGTAQIMPLSMRFDYAGMDGKIKTADDKKWMIRIPIITSENGAVGFIFVDGTNVQSEEFAALKQIADANSADQNTIQKTKNAMASVEKYADKHGFRLGKEDHWNISSPTGNIYSTEINEIVSKK